MKLPENDYQILRLTDLFYKRYPNPPRNEILKKQNRAEYLDNKDALIDKDEFNETVKNLDKIKQDALEYVENYISHIKGNKPMHPAEFKRKYGFSTLQYFHKELGLNI